MDIALSLCRAVHYASAMLLFGASAFNMALPRDARAAEGTLRPFYAGAALIAFATAVLWFLLTAANMTGAPSAMLHLQMLHLVLLYTDFGTLWIWRLVIALALAAWIFATQNRGPGFVFLSAAFLASLAVTGHAAIDTGWSGLAHRTADAVHLLSVGLWLGGLVTLLAVFNAGTRDTVLTALRRFAVVAAPAVALVLVTGAANTLFIVPEWNGFAGTRYGIFLVVKLAFAAAMIGLALLNRLVLLPRLSAGDAAAGRRLYLSAAGEIVLGALVLAIVGILGLTQP